MPQRVVLIVGVGNFEKRPTVPGEYLQLLASLPAHGVAVVAVATPTKPAQAHPEVGRISWSRLFFVWRPAAVEVSMWQRAVKLTGAESPTAPGDLVEQSPGTLPVSSPSSTHLACGLWQCDPRVSRQARGWRRTPSRIIRAQIPWCKPSRCAGHVFSGY